MLVRPSTCSGCPLHDDKIAIGFSLQKVLEQMAYCFSPKLWRTRGRRRATVTTKRSRWISFHGNYPKLSGVERNHFTISNAIWCRPGVRNYLTVRRTKSEPLNTVSSTTPSSSNLDAPEQSLPSGLFQRELLQACQDTTKESNLFGDMYFAQIGRSISSMVLQFLSFPPTTPASSSALPDSFQG